MKKESLSVIELIRLYTSLTNTSCYEDKLKLWEEHLSFQTMEYHRIISSRYLKEEPLISVKGRRSGDDTPLTTMLHLSIKPENSEEAVAYNRWVINLWRKYYTEKQRESTLHQFRFPLLHAEQQKFDLADKLSKLQQFDKSSLLCEISDQISREISKTPHKDLLMEACQHFLTDNDDGVFRLTYPSNLSTLRELRIIGKFWDQLKFFVFVEREKKKLKIKRDLHFKLTALTERQMDFLFSELKEKSFVSPDTCEVSFYNMLRQLPIKSKILWIDVPLKNKTVVNKGTLISFLDRLGVNGLPDLRLLYDFLCTNFEVRTGEKIERDPLKSANNSRMNTDQIKHKRYSALDNIIDDMLNLS